MTCLWKDKVALGRTMGTWVEEEKFLRNTNKAALYLCLQSRNVFRSPL